MLCPLFSHLSNIMPVESPPEHTRAEVPSRPEEEEYHALPLATAESPLVFVVSFTFRRTFDCLSLIMVNSPANIDFRLQGPRQTWSRAIEQPVQTSKYDERAFDRGLFRRLGQQRPCNDSSSIQTLAGLGLCL